MRGMNTIRMITDSAVTVFLFSEPIFRFSASDLLINLVYCRRTLLMSARMSS